MLRLLCATANPGKVAELAELLAPVALLMPRPDGIGEVIEDAPTLAGNALIKARAVCESAHNIERLPAIADDTGLEVDSLGGAPGVRSARYAADRDGGTPDDARNRARLLAELAELAELAGRAQHDRRARFRTVVAVVWPDDGPGSVSVAGTGRELVVEGVCEGHIALAERGAGGFGYDALFVPDGGPMGPNGPLTFAEMTREQKQAISHRGRAIAALVEALRGLEA